MDALCDSLRGLMAQALREGGQRLIDAATQDLGGLVRGFLDKDKENETSSGSSNAPLCPPTTSSSASKKDKTPSKKALAKALRRTLLVDIDVLRKAYAGDTTTTTTEQQHAQAEEPRVPGLPPHTALVHELQLQALLTFVLGTLDLENSAKGAGEKKAASSSCCPSKSVLKRVHRYLADLQLRQTFSLGSGSGVGVGGGGGSGLMRRSSSSLQRTSSIATTASTLSTGSVDLDEDVGGGAHAAHPDDDCEEDVAGRRQFMDPTRLLDTSFERFLAKGFLEPFRATQPEALLALYSSLECEELLPPDLVAAATAASFSTLAADGGSPGQMMMLLDEEEDLAAPKRGPVFRGLGKEKAAASGFVSAYATRNQQRTEREKQEGADKAQAHEAGAEAKRKSAHATAAAKAAAARGPPPPPAPPSESSILQQALTASQRVRPSHYLNRVNSFRTKPSLLSRRPLPLQTAQQQQQQQQQAAPQVHPRHAAAMALEKTRSDATAAAGAAASSSSSSSSIIKRAPAGGLQRKRQQQQQQQRHEQQSEGALVRKFQEAGIASPVRPTSRGSSTRVGKAGGGGSTILGTPPPSMSKKRSVTGGGAMVAGTPEAVAALGRNIRAKRIVAETPR